VSLGGHFSEFATIDCIDFMFDMCFSLDLKHGSEEDRATAVCASRFISLHG
jgi:hypothetical protein